MEGSSIEALRERGAAVKLTLESIPAQKFPAACRARLLKLVRGELNFVDKLLPCGENNLPSSNFGHFEAIAQVLQHPLVSGICAVNQKFPSAEAPAHVDLVGLFDGKPAWFVVSDRNPKHNQWTSEHGLQSKTALLLRAATSNPLFRPSCVVFYFARGIEKAVERSFEAEFKACRIETDELAEEDWLLVDAADDADAGEPLGNGWIALPGKAKRRAVVYRVDVAGENVFEAEVINVNVLQGGGADAGAVQKGIWFSSGDGLFYSLLEDVSRLWSGEVIYADGEQATKLVNLDTTALIGMVSGLSNNIATSIASWSNQKLQAKYSSFGHFFRDQALLELEKPFLPELATIFKRKQPVVSEFAWMEFESIVSVVGGPDEQRRAAALHACFKHLIVQDNSSERVAALPLTGKVHGKHKIVFGTGDKLQAPTLTSNVSFVRAVTSKGMALAIIEHRPLALTRD